MGARDETAGEQPFVCEREVVADDAPFDPWTIVACTLVGALAGLVAAAAVGLSYLRSNPDVEYGSLVVPFAVYVVATGALAFGGIRIALIVAPRFPIVAGVVSGAMVGIAPGAYGAGTFGAQSLPFIGAIGFAIAALPFVCFGILAQTLSDGSRGLRAALASLTITVLLALLSMAALPIVRAVGAPSMLDGLRELLYLGLERVGALTGIVAGVVVGGAMGLGVRLARGRR